MQSLYEYKSKTVQVLVLILVAGSFLISVPLISFADDRPGAIRDFNRPSSFNAGEIDYEDLERRTFYTRGTLDAVSDKAITIGDVPIDLAPDVRINCKVGMYVGIKVNDEGKAISCEPLDRPRR
ncbi:MAG: hypothetical protein HF978_03180 [Desulfobacteraceae bacterium]|nr:hypothetical protein [Desulfobacteraceae bacterium]MBC2754528.1 hypothetical protein [Desulfobacteraceae bacterium]MBC2763807.1 hypothetical protein [ANME-2 cluster archaeon]